MRNIKNLMKILLILLVPAYSFADAGDWTPAKKISSIFVEGTDTSPRATLALNGGIESNYISQSCVSNYISIDLSNEKGKAIYSLALAARMADKEIYLSLPDCLAGRPLVGIIRL